MVLTVVPFGLLSVPAANAWAVEGIQRRPASLSACARVISVFTRPGPAESGVNANDTGTLFAELQRQGAPDSDPRTG